MVGYIPPILILAIGLGTAFALGLFHSLGTKVANFLMLLAIAVMAFISWQWSYGFMFSNMEPQYIFTAGYKPPISISLLMGKTEAMLTLFINIVAFLSAIFMSGSFKKRGVSAMAVYLLLVMGFNGLVMTRDIFNTFVFLEIMSIGTAGLILLDANVRSLGAGFKYMIASSIISGFLLLGIALLYSHTGTLNIDDMIGMDIPANIPVAALSVFLVVVALVVELKPFPANGWALDVYESAHPGLAAVISGAGATATLYALYKVIAFAGFQWAQGVAVIGLITFVGSNLLAVKQTAPNRLLGYSSISQIGLLMAVIGLKDVITTDFVFIASGLLFTHILAKTTLFWISGIIKKNDLKGWAVVRSNPFLLVLAGTAIFALSGFPPFPSFFAKWKLIMGLADTNNYLWISLILLGSFFEVIYLFRWLGYMIKVDIPETGKERAKSFMIAVPTVTVIMLYALGFYFAKSAGIALSGGVVLGLFAIVLFALDWLPAKVKNTLVLAAMAYYAWWLYNGQVAGLRLVFVVIFIVGGFVLFLTGYYKTGKRIGFYPVAVLMYAGLGLLLEAKDTLTFFMAWELMTAGSYFLIIRGKKSMPHGLSYLLFSVAGAYLMMAGFAIVYSVSGSFALTSLTQSGEWAGIVFALLAVAFMTKTASVPLHIWLPGAHGEAESDVSPMVSAVLLKAGVFGLMLLMISIRHPMLGSIDLAYVLSWIGAITVLLGNLMAVFQEDAKRLLAYSSVGQLGYVVFSMAFMSHLGWLTAAAFAINHFMFKAMLFLAIGGVVMRVKTKNMYEMGGLIRRMPFTFVSVLVGIIALAGMPPLSGFAGKWLSYNAIIERGWYLQGAMMSIGGLVAFLYVWRLIHTIFLGQLKDEHRHVKEAPIWFLIPQYLFLSAILFFSYGPAYILRPIGQMLMPYFPENALRWEETTAHSLYGYWDGVSIIHITLVLFVVLIAWLLFVGRKAQIVKQFNIVYAAERPSRPETTHVAYNVFAHYKKALWFLVVPLATAFWNFTAELVHSVADFVRKLYTGNGQTYAIHVLLFVLVFYLITIGG